YWAPQGLDADLDDLRSIGSRLAHVHVYEWEPDGRRHSLAAGADAWPARLELVGSIPVGGDHRAFPRRTALLEFVADDDPAARIADAATLTRWVGATTDAPAADGREDDERP
ncbi:MAG: hypothetical protein ACXWBN_07640, partial [Acidimicrobiales bacterium]